ncbi:hypothetical protein ACVWXO_000558 [Bradyrhizobium sp. LM2.7]
MKLIGLKTMRSPGLGWPTFHSSALAIVTGHTKPPRLPRMRMTGISLVKVTEAMAYSQSWMLEGCNPASPPSLRVHVGFGPTSRMPSRWDGGFYPHAHLNRCGILDRRFHQRQQMLAAFAVNPDRGDQHEIVAERAVRIA